MEHKQSSSELLFASLAGAAIGMGYRLYQAYTATGPEAVPTLFDYLSAAAVGALAALLAVVVRGWVNSTKD